LELSLLNKLTFVLRISFECTNIIKLFYPYIKSCHVDVLNINLSKWFSGVI